MAILQWWLQWHQGLVPHKVHRKRVVTGNQLLENNLPQGLNAQTMIASLPAPVECPKLEGNRQGCNLLLGCKPIRYQVAKFGVQLLVYGLESDLCHADLPGNCCC